MKLLMISVFILLYYFKGILCDFDCPSLLKCGECIGNALTKCVWCTQEGKVEPRCQSVKYAEKNKSWCKKEFIYDPKHTIQIIKNNNFSSGTNESDAIQFKPQNINIKVRPGVPVDFDLSYKPAEDFPLDVYFLMDSSDTMSKSKEDIYEQASEIYAGLLKLTKNVRLGIGSFVEKPAFPYYDKYRIPKKNESFLSHAFKNELPLTREVELFKYKLKEIPFGANYDKPEAGFDGLMQAMTCHKEVGWRNDSRHIIVYVTDNTYHSVGDGKILGIIKLNNMKCNLAENASLIYDYPSVSQINMVALEGKFKIVYLVKSEVSEAYTALEKQVLDSKYAELKNNSKTLEIIKKAYDELVASVILNYNWPDFVKLKTNQKCDSESKLNCKSTPENPIVNIKAQLTVNKCTIEKVHNLTIGLRGIRDKLIINLEIDCECDCENLKENVSTQCNNAGLRKCGICYCNDGVYGEICDCNGTSTTIQAYAKCIDPNSESKDACHARGKCICGLCKNCIQSYGRYCEYTNERCRGSNSLICNDHGNCIEGECLCDSEWSGIHCTCTKSDEPCKNPFSDKTCSGHGDCNCGKCECHKKYSGTYCDSCDGCAEKRCKDFEDYVLCKYMNNTCELYKKEIQRTTIRMVNKTVFETNQEWLDAQLCEKLLDDGTGGTVLFKYRLNNSTRKFDLFVQNEAKPPNKANIIYAVVGSLGGVLLIGLLTFLAWKILIDLHDAREYKKFSQNAAAEGYDVSMNPLYNPPEVNFNNPMYDEAVEVQ